MSGMWVGVFSCFLSVLPRRAGGGVRGAVGAAAAAALCIYESVDVEAVCGYHKFGLPLARFIFLLLLRRRWGGVSGNGGSSGGGRGGGGLVVGALPTGLPGEGLFGAVATRILGLTTAPLALVVRVRSRCPTGGLRITPTSFFL